MKLEQMQSCPAMQACSLVIGSDNESDLARNVATTSREDGRPAPATPLRGGEFYMAKPEVGRADACDADTCWLTKQAPGSLRCSQS
jgi:hypothetical protein